MDRLLSLTHPLTHPFDSYLSRIAGVAIGLTLLWYGSSWLSVAGLVVMFFGLIAVVCAAVPPRLSLRTEASPYLDVDMQTPHVHSYQ
jgi:hypothetical protein